MQGAFDMHLWRYGCDELTGESQVVDGKTVYKTLSGTVADNADNIHHNSNKQAEYTGSEA